MLQRTLGSGWGVLLPGVIIVGLAFIGLSAYALKLLIVSGLLLSALMLYHNITAFCIAAIVYGAYWRHDVGNDELESGMKMKRQRKDKIIGARGGT